MKKIVCLFLIVCFTSTVLLPRKAHAEIPVKAKAFLTIAGYGTAGGALLGFASMAFGSSTRAIAKGASLGLYAGILFGTYVLVSHHQKQMGYYDDDPVYQNSTDIYGDEYKRDEGGGSGFRTKGFFDRFEVMQDPMYHQNFTFQSQKTKTVIPPIHMNVFQYSW